LKALVRESQKAKIMANFRVRIESFETEISSRQNPIKTRVNKMKRKLSVLLLAALAATVLLAAGCPERTSIADIEANPSKFENKKSLSRAP
jgi:hypothetical protein